MSGRFRLRLLRKMRRSDGSKDGLGHAFLKALSICVRGAWPDITPPSPLLLPITREFVLGH